MAYAPPERRFPRPPRSSGRIGPGRRLLSEERGTVFKDSGGRISVALIYPNRYRVGMSNLGFQTIYRHLNRREDVVCERTFLPDLEEEVELRRTGGRLRALESGRSIARFHILAFSVSFENDYPHLLALLDLAGIPLNAEDRNDRHPLVMLGGAVTFLNPEPLARFVDLMVVGEAEETLDEYFDLLRGRLPPNRAAHLREVAEIPGIYIPRLHTGPSDRMGEGTERSGERRGRHPVDLSRFPAYSTILTRNTEFSDTLLVEIARGCPWGCRFCAAGHIYRPFRTLPVERVLDIVRGRPERERPPLRKVGLVSSAVCDYPRIDRLCEELRRLDLRIGVSSIRADRLSDALLRTLVHGGLRTLTLAPEAGSDRLRKAIGKRMDTERILEAASRAVSCGVPNLRLYGMIGLPSETDEDLAQLADLTLKVRERMKRAGGHGSGRLTLSITPFVPKPQTPFQRKGMASTKELRRKLGGVREILRREPGIRIKTEGLRAVRFQALLSRGDRRIADLLLAYHHRGGRWEQAARDVGIDVDRYLEEIPSDAPLPWASSE